ncbi:MAG: HAD hydrolase-like protein [Symploca sp. SIO3C6]|uniref:HAD hydrolase-like protein n=1 Tax=Symploca sp. SIO1C4 TaxID=2607765 RepID=A0A6B3NC05_9CYAN|nr:HAD hydrolase-like protein [Symploca sp. SIO3C6]NER28465.1 HAD hydrolase-like protein [Symploca sp. SIO1C4]NET05245.1 HAD hydrolase-like protein [Symploca sp. SIO2B6]
MTVKVIIFDFDGTVADTLDAIVSITNRLAIEFGYKPITPEEIAQVRKLSSREIIKESGIPIFKIPFLIKRVKENLRSDIQQLNPVSGIKEALIHLHSEDKILGILTSNSEANVKDFLKQHDMQELFSFVFSANTLFGKHKVLRKIMIHNNWESHEVIYVGDETRDIVSSKKINMKVIAVSWGFNSEEALAEQNPDFLIAHPRELLEIIGSLKEPALFSNDCSS